MAERWSCVLCPLLQSRHGGEPPRRDMRRRCEAAILDADDPVAIAHRGETMRNNEHRAVLHDTFHVDLNHALALVIERAGRFVEDEDRRVRRQRPRYGDPLTLSAGQVGGDLPFFRYIEALNELRQRRLA